MLITTESPSNVRFQGWTWDWYAATLPEDVSVSGVDVLGHLADEPIGRVPGLYGYSRGWTLKRDGSVLARVFQAHGRRDHVVASGSESSTIVAALRSHVPGHSVSRADVATDFSGGDESFKVVRGIAHNLLRGSVTLTDLVERGIQRDARTLYIGKRKGSEVFGRLYQSGLIHSEQALDTNRLEYEVKPGKAERKRHLAGLEAHEVVGWSRWSRGLAESIWGFVSPAAPPRSARVSDREGAWNALAAQYGRRLYELIEFHGGDLEGAVLDLLSRVPDSVTAELLGPV